MTGRHWEDGGPREVGSKSFASQARFELRSTGGAAMVAPKHARPSKGLSALFSLADATRCVYRRRTFPEILERRLDQADWSPSFKSRVSDTASTCRSCRPADPFVFAMQ